MKRIVFLSIWCLILAAAAYDGYFAWQNRADFESWEINPFARWVVQSFCIEAMVTVKILGVAFATFVAFSCHRIRNRLEIPLTVFVSSCYLFLTIHYALGFMTPPEPANPPVLASRALP
jgi:hypothetical protein